MENQKQEWDLVISHLQSWREDVLLKLRSVENHEEMLKLKRQLDRAIGCLELCQSHQIRPGAKVTVLPPTQTSTPSSNYRVLEDHETEHSSHWVEMEINGEPLNLYPGDIVISE